MVVAGYACTRSVRRVSDPMNAAAIAAIVAGVPTIAAAIVAIIAAFKSNTKSTAALQSSVAAHMRLNAINAPKVPVLPTREVPPNG